VTYLPAGERSAKSARRDCRRIGIFQQRARSNATHLDRNAIATGCVLPGSVEHFDRQHSLGR
jgi:hypothetical protein